eukprot:jgi/Galph1/719/GphlegSOOS_G5441.1
MKSSGTSAFLITWNIHHKRSIFYNAVHFKHAKCVLLVLWKRPRTNYYSSYLCCKRQATKSVESNLELENFLSEAKEKLVGVFGHTKFLEGQEQVLRKLFTTGNALAILPTGGGKSLCYQLPALIFPGLTLVVSPLIALMREQVEKLVQLGVPAAHMDSSQSGLEIRSVRRALTEQKLKILFVSPERFNNESFLAALKSLPISLFAVDEAHCISEWGHNFRPDYLRLAHFARDCRAMYRLGLTATATERVAYDITRRLSIPTESVVRTRFHRSNLVLNMSYCASETEKRRQLLKCLKSREPGPTLIYVTLQRTADELASFLVENGFQAQSYHAGLSDEQRLASYQWFTQAVNPIIAATIAFGMGVDKPNIRYVYHYNLSKSLEAYSQEVGRAGRDGNKSFCDTFFSASDIPVLETFIYGNTPEKNQLGFFLHYLFEHRRKGDIIHLPLYELSSRFDIRDVVLHTLLVFLDVHWNLIKELTPMFTEYRFQILVPEIEDSESWLMSHLTESQRQLWQKIIQHIVRKLKWSYLNLGNLTGSVEPEHVQLLFDFMQSKGLIKLQASKLQHRVQFLDIPNDLWVLENQLHQLVLDREMAETRRLEEMIQLATQSHCVSQALSLYFGERIDLCGSCYRCTGTVSNGNQEVDMALKWFAPLNINIWNAIVNISEVSNEPLLLTKFACGISSPRLRSLKLTQHELYGSLRECGFQQVLQVALEHTRSSQVSSLAE